MLLKSTFLLISIKILLSTALFAQVAGIIVDADNQTPIPDVNILVDGTLRGTTTDAEGRFRIYGESLPLTLRISAVGYQPILRTFAETSDSIFIEMRVIRIASDEILVHGGRIMAGLHQKNPIPVTTITYDDLQLKQNSTAADLLRAETGVYVQQTTPGQGSIYIRGRAGRDVLYLFNGLRMNPSFVRSGQNQYFGSIDPFSVEQLDVFRGPVSTFYGSDALSGGVNIIPRQARTGSNNRLNGRFQSQLNVGGNGDKTIHAELGHQSRSFAVALSGTYRDFSYYAMSPDTDESLWYPYGRRLNNSDFSFQAINGSLAWRVGSRSLIQAHAYSSIIPDAPRWDRMILGHSGADSPARFYDSNTAPLAISVYQVEFDQSFRMSWLSTMSVRAGYHQLKDFRRSIRFETTPNIRLALDRSSARDEETRDDNTSDQLLLSVDMKSVLKNKALLTWGADLSHDVTSSHQYIQNDDGNVSQVLLSRFPDGSTYIQTGIFAHLYYAEAKRWTFEGGLRYSSSYASLPMEGVTSERAFNPYSQWFSQLTGSAGASYNLGSNVYLVGNLGSGFRAPNVADLSEVGVRRSDLYQSANPDLKPEQSVNLDLGLRVGSEALVAEFSSFIIHYFNKIDVEYTGEVVDIYGRRLVDGRTPQPGNDLYFESQSANASSMNLLGLEGNIKAVLHPNLKSGLIVNYTHGKIKNGDGVKDYVDRIPPVNGVVFVESKFFDSKLRIRPQARFALAKRNLSMEEIGDDRISPNGTNGFVNMQIISTFDIAKKVQLRVFADNLSNSAYREHASTLDGMARNITFSVNYAF